MKKTIKTTVVAEGTVPTQATTRSGYEYDKRDNEERILALFLVL